jgi:UDP-glucose 4-epimerase
MTRVFVTGAGGFLGGAIARHLASQGYEVLGLVRRPAGIVPVPFECVYGDLSASAFQEDIKRLMAPCDAIVHAAASLDVSLSTPESVASNTLGVLHVVSLAREWGASPTVFLSSATMVGRPRYHPITEEHPLNPLTPYHASKLLGERMVATVCGSRSAVSSLRVTAPIGPGMPSSRLLSILVSRALRGEAITVNGKGTRRQDYVDVRDVASAVEKCLERRVSGTFNLGSGVTTSNEELARLCIEVAGSKSEVILGGAPDPDDGVVWDVSIEKAQRELGYCPRYSLRESVGELVELYRSG